MPGWLMSADLQWNYQVPNHFRPGSQQGHMSVQEVHSPTRQLPEKSANQPTNQPTNQQTNQSVN